MRFVILSSFFFAILILLRLEQEGTYYLCLNFFFPIFSGFVDVAGFVYLSVVLRELFPRDVRKVIANFLSKRMFSC